MTRFHIVAAAMVAITLAGGSAAGQPVDAEVAAAVVGEDNFPLASVHFPNGVMAYPDLAYATIPGFQPLKLDLYARPSRPGTVARPLVVYIHGGAWMGGHSRASAAFGDFPRVLASLAARGYVVASVNYRLSGEARFPAAFQDVRAAIDYLRAHADRFGIDPRRVIFWGASAGGQLAALVSTTCGASISGTPPQADCVQGAVIWYGVFDLRSPEPGPGAGSAPSPVSAYLGCDPRACPDVAASASPIAHVDSADPPMLLLHGIDDRTVPADQTRRMAARLREAGVPVETLLLPGIDHSWIGPTPEATRRASLRALQRTFDFIDELMARPR